MKKLIVQMITLMVICGICAGLLAGVYNVTSKVIAENAQKRMQELCKEIFPNVESFEEIPFEEEGMTLFKADDKGYVVSSTTNGYGGDLSVIVGIDKNGKILSTTVLSQKETAGIGSKILQADFSAQFVGKDENSLSQVDTITGATISSSAYIDAVKKAVEAIAGVQSEEKGTQTNE